MVQEYKFGLMEPDLKENGCLDMLLVKDAFGILMETIMRVNS
jgi:hypothetical protein